MPEPIFLIYLDDYHLEDLLYVPSLAQKMGRMRRACPPCLFVHGGGGQDERLLEAEGLFPERKAGVLQVASQGEAALVERAMRQVNRRLVGALTEEGVPAVGFQGGDRGLLRQGDGAAVMAGRVGWLEALIQQRVVPVVSALVQGAEGGAARAVQPAAALAALARALRASEIIPVFLTRTDQPGVVEGRQTVRQRPLDAVPEAVLPDREAIRRVVEAGFQALLTSASGLFGGEERRGTMVFSIKTPKKD